MRRYITILLTVIALLALPGASFAAVPVISVIEYNEYTGEVEAEFARDVWYNASFAVKVTDSAGVSYQPYGIEKDEDEVSFYISGAVEGRVYAVEISGVALLGSAEYTTVKGSFSTQSTPDKPTVKKVEYSSGKVEVEFSQKVRYSNATLTVTDEAGVECASHGLKLEDDEFSFRLTAPVSGNYTALLSGVAVRQGGAFTSVTAKFRVPDQPLIEKVSYDADDREVEFDFAAPVRYKNFKVVIKDANGNKVARRGVRKDNDDVTIKLKRPLTISKQYSYTISGVALRGGGSFTSLSGTFTAQYDD